MNLTEEEIKLMQEIKSIKISKERFAELVKEEVSEYNKKLSLKSTVEILYNFIIPRVEILPKNFWFG